MARNKLQFFEIVADVKGGSAPYVKEFPWKTILQQLASVPPELQRPKNRKELRGTAFQTASGLQLVVHKRKTQRLMSETTDEANDPSAMDGDDIRRLNECTLVKHLEGPSNILALYRDSNDAVGVGGVRDWLNHILKEVYGLQNRVMLKTVMSGQAIAKVRDSSGVRKIEIGMASSAASEMRDLLPDQLRSYFDTHYSSSPELDFSMTLSLGNRKNEEQEDHLKDLALATAETRGFFKRAVVTIAPNKDVDEDELSDDKRTVDLLADAITASAPIHQELNEAADLDSQFIQHFAAIDAATGKYREQLVDAVTPKPGDPSVKGIAPPVLSDLPDTLRP